MRRFSSLQHAPAETRKLLRERFTRFLPFDSPSVSDFRQEALLPDEVIVRLFSRLLVEHADDLQAAKKAYGEASRPGSTEASFEDLIAQGWLRVVWDRVFVPRDVAEAARHRFRDSMPAFIDLLQKRYDDTYRISGTDHDDPALAGVIAAIESGDAEPRDSACQRPDWVAGRLWELGRTQLTDVTSAMRVWVARWNELGKPHIVPKHVWSEVDAEAFRSTALLLLGSRQALLDWEGFRNRLLKKMALKSGLSFADIEIDFPRLPDTLVDRVLWLDRPAIEEFLTMERDATEDLLGIGSLLLAEIGASDYSPAPDPFAGSLFGLATRFPEFLFSVLIALRTSPALLADLLLYPPTSPLAFLEVARWPLKSGPWDRSRIERDDQLTKAIATADAAEVLCEFLGRGSVPPNEFAALLVWLYDQVQDDLVNSQRGASALDTLNLELVKQSPETMTAILSALISQGEPLGVGTARLAAVLDILQTGRLATETNPLPVLHGYVQSLAAGIDATSATRIGPAGAAALFGLAERAPSELSAQVLFPFEVKKRMDQAEANGENPYTAQDNLARALRAHIRILSRAVGGFRNVPEPFPAKLAEALTESIKAAAVTHREKGRIGSFAPRYDSERANTRSAERPIAAELGTALSALGDEHRDRVLSAILETDPPCQSR
jgi:hypothetical protein